MSHVGFLPGSESLSKPSWFIISVLLSPSTSFDIHAIFVNTLSLSPASSTTLHSISILSELGSPSPVYAGKLLLFPDTLTNVNLFIFSS